MTKKTQQIIDTYTRIAISGNSVLMDIIGKHTQTSRQKAESTDEGFATKILLTDQVNDILSGPYAQFIKHKLSAYSKVLRMKVVLQINTDDTFKLARKTNSLTTDIPEKFLKKFDKAKLKEIDKSLDALCEQHYQQLIDFFNQAAQQLMQALRANNVEFNVLEIAEFSEQVPLRELLNRFTELNLTPPKNKNEDFSFCDYLKLRAHLAIHSSLSRQHQDNTPEAIKPYFKKLNSCFKKIRDDEQKLLNTQAKETQKLVGDITYKVTTSKQLQKNK